VKTVSLSLSDEIGAKKGEIEEKKEKESDTPVFLTS